MASQRDVKNKIASVKNIQKITRAMEMVAAARLRRAEQRIAALRIRLHETAGQIRSAGDWARYLRAAARLHGETWANVLLISSRIPDATLVRGYEAWRAAGRRGGHRGVSRRC